jgi:hypothetical protein
MTVSIHQLGERRLDSLVVFEAQARTFTGNGRM